MSDWIGNIISGIALGVSGLSLFISIRTAQRAINAAKVTAWIDPLQRTGSSEWLLATLNVKNPSHTDIKVEKVGIDLPDFRVGDVNEASVDDGSGNRVLPNDIVVKSHYAAMPLAMAVGAGETSTRTFLIYQPAHSRRRQARLSVMYWTMEPKQKWRILPVVVQTRSDL